jgi:hypothetical protein
MTQYRTTESGKAGIMTSLFKKPKLTTAIKVGRLFWAGYIQCMREDQMSKTLLNAKPNGRRNVGKPRTRWLDVVNKDARKIRISGWWSRALDREKWRTLLEEAMTLNELYSF